MAIVSATIEQFTAFLTKYGYEIADDESALLPLSFTFLSTLPFCSSTDSDDQIIEAQCFIAYSMSANGGGFNPAAIAEAKTLTKKGLGRGAITKEWAVNELLNGTDPVSMLRAMPIAYGLLNGYLCRGGGGGYVV